DAVEQHVGAGAQAGHRAVEDDAVKRALGRAADVLEPIDKAEDAGDHRQREHSDQDVICFGFHLSPPAIRSTLLAPNCPHANASRGSRLSARDDWTRAWCSSPPPQ